mmetsp:Transcript_20040/g.49868  ORF Transcript_20040/g.49868 Transcript_20040/m.49868 type:complete len:343 (+) Transcript_20040:1954-2982(+)
MALMTLDLPALNSPTMTSRNSSSSPFRASTRRLISSSAETASVRNTTASSNKTRSRSSTACVTSSRSLPAMDVDEEEVAEAAAEGLAEVEEDLARAALTASIVAGIPPAAAASGGALVSKTPCAPASTRGVTPPPVVIPAHPSVGGAKTGTLISALTAATTWGLGAKMRSAPSLAATSAPSASRTRHATMHGPLKLLRATTTGTPSSLRTTPSASAEVAISVRSATSSAARPRSASLSASAALKRSRVVASPPSSESTTAVAPAATAASMAAAVPSSFTLSGATVKINPGMRTSTRFLAANSPPPSFWSSLSLFVSPPRRLKNAPTAFVVTFMRSRLLVLLP